MSYNPWSSERSEAAPLLPGASDRGSRDNEQGGINRRLDELAEELGHVTYLDNLRIFLTIVVVYHHVAVLYGEVGVCSGGICGMGSSNLLPAFTGLNATFVPALFLILSGYFSRKSLRSKGAIPFMKAKLWRLGVPLLVYTFVIMPLVIILSFPLLGKETGRELGSYFWNLRGAGGYAGWYLALLLFFDGCLALYSWTPFPYLHLPEMSVQRFHFLCAGTLTVVTLFSYVIRVKYPLGVILHPFGVLSGRLPQLILAYIAGTCFSSIEPFVIYARFPWLNLLWRYALSIGTAIIFVLILGKERVLRDHKGGWNITAFLFEVWTEMSFYLLAPAWLTFFAYIDSPESSEIEKRFFSLRRYFKARYSYGVILIHGVVLTVLGWVDLWPWWRDGPLVGVLKTVIVGTLTLLGSYAISWKVVESVPAVADVI